MATRRHLLLAASAVALWVGTFRFGPDIASRFRGLDPVPSERVPGFRTLGAGPGARSTGGGGPAILAGLEPAAPLPAGLERRVANDPIAALFDAGTGTRDIVPVAYFFDYYCPYCRVLSDRLAALTESGQIALTRHHWPIFGTASDLAARAALGADALGHGNAMHARLMDTPMRVTPAYLAAVTGEIGLDWPALSRAMRSPRVDASLDRTRALARLFGFIGTPSLVLGRTIVEGEVSDVRLRDVLRLEHDD